MEGSSDEYVLTADEMGMIKPLIDTVENLQKEAQAILRGISRVRNLQGDWVLNEKKMIRTTTTGAAPPEEKG